MHPCEVRLLADAAARHGLFTYDQARAAGISDTTIRRRLLSGAWVEVRPRVYSLTAVPETWHRKVLASVLEAGPGTVASHRSAAALWNIGGVRRGAAEITTSRRFRHRRSDVLVHHKPLPEAHRTEVSAIPVTTAARTLFDLGAVEPWALTRATDDALRQGHCDYGDLVATLLQTARRGRPGTRRFRAEVERRSVDDRIPDSALERAIYELLVGAGIPAPQIRHPVACPDGRTVEVDLCWPAYMLGLEADGRIAHGLAELPADIRRQNQLMIAGYHILRYTWHDLVTEPDRIISEVRAAIAARAHLLSHNR